MGLELGPTINSKEVIKAGQKWAKLCVKHRKQSQTCLAFGFRMDLCRGKSCVFSFYREPGILSQLGDGAVGPPPWQSALGMCFCVGFKLIVSDVLVWRFCSFIKLHFL